MKGKLKIGLFSLTSCEGCMLHLFQDEERFMQMLRHVEIVNSRLLKEKNSNVKLDVAIIEGSVNSKREEEKLKRYRKNASYVISLGSCAGSGCVQAMRNALPERMQEYIRKNLKASARKKVGKIDDFIMVDYYMRGCPVDAEEFYCVMTKLIHNIKPKQYDTPVCKECKENEIACLLLQGKACLGAISYGGCKAVCPTEGGYCNGCRGFTKDANIAALKKVLRNNGLSKRDIAELFQVYNTFGGENA